MLGEPGSRMMAIGCAIAFGHAHRTNHSDRISARCSRQPSEAPPARKAFYSGSTIWNTCPLAGSR